MSEWSFCESARQSEISIPEQFCTFAQFFTLIPALSCFHSPPIPLVSASPVVLIWLPKEPRRGVVLGQQFCLYSEGRATRWYQNTRHFCPKFPTKIYLSDIKWHFFELRIKLSAPFETCQFKFTYSFILHSTFHKYKIRQPRSVSKHKLHAFVNIHSYEKNPLALKPSSNGACKERYTEKRTSLGQKKL